MVYELDALRDRSVLVLGQLTTSQTPNILSALKNKVHVLAVVGLPGIRQKQKGSYLFIKDGTTRNERRFVFPTPRKYYFLFPFYYLFGIIAILRYVFSAKQHFDVVIGVSTFYAVMALLFRSLGICDRSIYYCLDYYPLDRTSFSQRLFVYVFRKLDKLCAVKCESTWNVTNDIIKTRAVIGRNDLLVPVTYPSNLLHLGMSANKKKRAIAFIGVISYLSGLQILIEAIPEIVRTLPDTRVEIIGDGEYLPVLKKRVNELSLQNVITFHGFVENDEECLKILSESTIGIATYAPVDGSYIWAADPGKPKLYAFLGLPCILTKWPVSLRMENAGAAITIDYSTKQMVNAVVRLLSDESVLEKYRQRTREYATAFVAENIYPDLLNNFFKRG